MILTSFPNFLACWLDPFMLLEYTASTLPFDAPWWSMKSQPSRVFGGLWEKRDLGSEGMFENAPPSQISYQNCDQLANNKWTVETIYSLERCPWAMWPIESSLAVSKGLGRRSASSAGRRISHRQLRMRLIHPLHQHLPPYLPTITPTISSCKDGTGMSAVWGLYLYVGTVLFGKPRLFSPFPISLIYSSMSSHYVQMVLSWTRLLRR